MFVGVSPEFEIALYTMCFHLGSDKNDLVLGDYDVRVKVYKFAGGRFLAAAYPEVIQ